MTEKLNKLNCMNYHVCNNDNEFWYAQNGLRSLYVYSKNSDTSFREICNTLYTKGEITINDTRFEGETFTLTMI